MGYFSQTKFSNLSFSVQQLLLFFICLSNFSCGETDYCKTPDTLFSEGQQKSIQMQLTLKTVPKPEGLYAPEEIRAYYESQAKSIFWHYAYTSQGRYFFFISCPAPSLYGKRIGIGGSFLSEDMVSIKNYREVFRTFKLSPEQLDLRGRALFGKMVAGEDLIPFQPGGSKTGNKEWIEFPDQLNYFDTLSQSWKIKTKVL
jgi:hypothetical protein